MLVAETSGHADPQRLCLDARMLGNGGTGVSTYSRALVAATELLARPRVMLHGTPVLGAFSKAIAAIRPGPRTVRRRADGDFVAADIFRIAQAHFNVYGRVLRLRAPGPSGIVHWSYPIPLAIAGWTNLYTIHDLIPLTNPELTPIEPARHRRMLAAIDRIADRFVSVSGAARTDILALLGIAPDRVVDCGQAVVREIAAGPLPEGLVPRGYLLFCGRIEARKNLARLIEAHARSAAGMPLILVGPVAEGGEAILEVGLRANPGSRHMPYVARATLVTLVARARGLLLPSLAEGFGLPVAEAMMLGTPTLISRDRALIETAGGAALIVDETDIAAIAAAIGRLARDDALCAELATLGRARAEAFTVAGFAARLDALYAQMTP